MRPSKKPTSKRPANTYTPSNDNKKYTHSNKPMEFKIRSATRKSVDPNPFSLQNVLVISSENYQSLSGSKLTYDIGANNEINIYMEKIGSINIIIENFDDNDINLILQEVTAIGLKFNITNALNKSINILSKSGDTFEGGDTTISLYQHCSIELLSYKSNAWLNTNI